MVPLLMLIGVGVMKSLASRNLIKPIPEDSWNSAFYPPGMNLVYEFFGLLGISAQSILIRPILILLTLMFLYLTARLVMGKTWYCLLALLLVVLNPYFLWSGLIQRDSAAEIMFLSSSLYFLLRTVAKDKPVDTHNLLITLAVGTFCLSMACLVRVTCFGVVGLWLIVCIILTRRVTKLRSTFICLTLYFTALSMGFCYYNYRLVGAFAPSTNLGYNLYLGNHPLYLHGHPKYDIDDFFETHYLPNRSFVSSGKLHSLSEKQQDDFFKARAWENMRANITPLFYRLIVKSYWYWFGIEKIPNYSGGAVLNAQGDQLILSEIGLWHNLPYLLYRLLFVPALVTGLAMMVRGYPPHYVWLFFAPLLALWFPSILTFPDTRFRLAAEILAIVGIVHCFKAWVENRGLGS
jgi:hypothetical protein